MRTVDFAPLWRSSIGFEHVADLVDADVPDEVERGVGEGEEPERAADADGPREPEQGSQDRPRRPLRVRSPVRRLR